jgi:hypothetical protein
VQEDGLTFVEGRIREVQVVEGRFSFSDVWVIRQASGVRRQVFLFLTDVGGVRVRVRVRVRVQSPKSTVGSRLSGSGVSRPRPAVTWESKSGSADG